MTEDTFRESSPTKKIIIFKPSEEQRERMKRMGYKIGKILEEYGATEEELSMIIMMLSKAIGLRAGIVGGKK